MAGSRCFLWLRVFSSKLAFIEDSLVSRTSYLSSVKQSSNNHQAINQTSFSSPGPPSSPVSARPVPHQRARHLLSIIENSELVMPNP